jgi:endonuclease YncB( thermonuclease family)
VIRPTAIVTALVLGLSQVQAGEIFTGVVTHVRDGDTIVVGKQPIRLDGVHAPEMRDDGGPEARAFVIDLVGGKAVSCDPMGSETYDRRVAVCYLDGEDIGRALIRAGLARDCPRYSKGRYADDEQADAARFGLPGYCKRR